MPDNDTVFILWLIVAMFNIFLGGMIFVLQSWLNDIEYRIKKLERNKGEVR